MQQFSTDLVRQESRFDYWRELVAREFVALDCDRSERGPFFGTLATHQLGLSRLLLVRSTSQRVTHSLERAARVSPDCYVLNYLAGGHARITQNANSNTVAAGEFFLFDLAARGELQLLGDFNILTLSLPRGVVDRHIAQAQCLCAIPVNTLQPGPGRVAADMLQSVAQNCAQMSDEDVPALIEGLVRVTAASFGSLPPSPENPATANAILLTAIRNYILCRLNEEDLTPARIAAAHGICERHVCKLFETEEITVSRWIWTQRLDEAGRMLSTASFGERTIKEIAHACGFKDMTHFSCAFKSRFGRGPRQYRQAQCPAVTARRSGRRRDRAPHTRG